MANITQGQAVTAYAALNRIRGKVKGHDALNLFHLKRQLQEAVDFQIEQEQQLVEKYGGKITGAGQVVISDKDKNEEFRKEYDELQSLEISVNIDIPVVDLDRCQDITMEDIEQLNGVIEFK